MRQAKLACEFLLASHFRRGPPMMSKTVLDLLHSLGVEDDMIMFDNFGGICEQIRSIFSQRRRPNFGGLSTRTRMRVLFYMVICASVFAENWGEISRFAHSVRVIKQLSTANTILRPSSATSALQMLFFVYYSRMIFGCFFTKKHFS